MSLSKQSAASLALYLAIAHPGIFDAFIGTLPGAVPALGRFGFFGDDGDDTTSDDFSTLDDNTDYENDDGSLQLLDVPTDDSSEEVDDSNINENLRELGVETTDDTMPPVTGSAADTGNLGVEPGSSADPLSQSLTASDMAIPDLNITSDESLDLNSVTPAVQSISGSSAVQSIGAPAVGAVTAALTSPQALNALGNITTAYLQNQAAAGEEQTALQMQANNISAQMQMAALDHPATGVAYVTGPNGQQEAVLSNASTGAPLVGANGQYIPAATGAGILSALTSSSAIGPLLIIGGIGLLLLLLLGHHPAGGGASGNASHAPRHRSPKFIEVE
jgi:hypothetical protein